LVYVSVSGSPELSRSYRVSPEGQMSLPLLKESIAVSGKVPSELGKSLTEALVREQVLTEPIVSVAVLEYRSRRVSIVGAVKSPVIVQAVGNFRLLDAIARAQGLAPEAGPEVIVSGAGGEDRKAETIHISVKELMSGKDESKNMLLHGGEEIRVPDAAKLYEVGNVKMQGTYPLTEMGGTTVMKVLAVTQGTLPYTSKSAYVYRVVDGASARQEIAIPLREILHRKAPDVALQANDILYIPENSAAHLSASVLERIAGFGSTVGSGRLVYY
jgi:polysaccharide export outer membrane protein